MINYLKRILFCLFIALPMLSNAQIESEIKAYVDSSEIILNNGRKLLVQSVINSDYEKSVSVYNYLQNEAAKQSYLAFSYTDILYISLLSHNWKEWVDYAKNYEEKIALPVFQDNHYISDRLYNTIRDNAEQLEKDVAEASIGQEDKDLISIMIHVIKEKELGKEYNTLISQYKYNHKNTKYADFLDNFLPKPKTKMSWNWGMGTTIVSPKGKYGDNFYTNATLYMNTDFNISKVYGSLYMGGGNLALREPFVAEQQSQNTYFYAKDKFTYFEGGGQIGYFLARTEYIHLAPYASIGGSSLKSNIYDPDEEELEFHIVNTFTYGLGLHTQLKIYEGETSPYAMYGYYGYSPYPVKHHFALKVNVGYNILASHIYNEFKGNIFYAQIGIVWGMGDF